MLRRSLPRLSLQMIQEPLGPAERTNERGNNTFANHSQSQTMRVGLVGGLFVLCLGVAATSPAPQPFVKSNE